MRLDRRGGQATIELVGAIPVLVGAVVVIWQIAAVVTTALSVEASVRAAALDPSRAQAESIRRTVPSLVPWARGLHVERPVPGIRR